MRHAREKIGSIRSENNNKTRSTNGTNDRISKEAKTPVILHKLKRVREIKNHQTEFIIAQQVS